MSLPLTFAGSSAGGSKFGFDPNAPGFSFTPSMAKRAGSVFDAAPIVQGNWDRSGTPDTITIPRGTQLGNPTEDTYANLDPYQGTITFWWTPERSRDATITDDEYLFISAGTFYCRYEHDNQIVRFGAGGGGSATRSLTTVAGTTYHVALRWDSKNTLDGTNYMCVSINNAHSFGATSLTYVAPLSTMYIGSNQTPIRSADAIIEGLTFYRRPLYDGTYGVPVTFDASGPVDEIEDIWAAGAGVDPCRITGSWDVVFCLPTDSAVGALATGTGEAWSHPHGSNELETWGLWDGFYGGGQWAVEFDGSTSGVDCGSAALDDIPSGAFTYEAWVRCDGIGSDGDESTIAQKALLGTDGWCIRLDSAVGRPQGIVYNNSELLIYTSTVSILDSQWHHIAMTYDDGGDKRLRLYIDGIYSGQSSAGTGVYDGDATRDLQIGFRDSSTYTWLGAQGWHRLSDNKRYADGVDFKPPREFPSADGNTVEAWSLNDGTGGTAVAQVTTPGNDGTITAGTWQQQWDDVLTPVIPTSLENDGSVTQILFGSEANLDDIPDFAVAGKGQLTMEGWFRFDELPPDNATIFGKGFGWVCFLEPVGDIRFNVYYSGDTSICDTGGTIDIPLGEWNHIAVTYDETGDRKAYIWFNGIMAASGTVSTGNYTTDAASSLGVATATAGERWEGAIGWQRCSDSIRYAADFVPPSRVNPPANDANAQLLVNMDDGAGTTVIDTSGNGYDGTITMGTGRWRNTPDMPSDSPGVRVYPWGYAIGSDAANDGIKQHKAGLDAGENYVARVPVRYEADRRAQPRVEVYDESNGSPIVQFDGPWLTGTHNGGDGQAALADSSAPYWPYSLVDSTVYNINDRSSATITASGGSIIGSLSGGSLNSWYNGQEYLINPPDNWVFCEPFTFKLPAACTEASYRLLNRAGEGTLYWQQVEVLENLIDNPSLKTGVLVPPWIPDGWTNSNLDPGDSVASSAGGGVIHSGVDCIEFAVGASGEGIYSATTGAVGRFVSTGYWNYGDGTRGCWLQSEGTAFAVLQSDATVFNYTPPSTAAWLLGTGIFRVLIADPSFYIVARAGAVGLRYADDAYAYLCDDVTLTVTPTSQVNSVESTGLRIDGRDVCTQPIPAGVLKANKGWIRWRMTPRHGQGDLLKWLESTSVYVATFFAGWNDYILLRLTANDTAQLVYDAGGAGAQNGTWVGTTLAVAVTDLLEIKYTGSRMQFLVNGVARITINAPVAFSVIPTIAYWGAGWNGAEIYRQVDATFGAP